MLITPMTSMEELYTFLLNKVGVYFTSVTANSSWDITCMDGDRRPLYLRNEDWSSSSPTGLCRINSKNSKIYNTSFQTDERFRIRIVSVIDTQYGLILYGYDDFYGVRPSIPVIVITKDNADNTVIFSHMYPSPSSSDPSNPGNGRDKYQCMNSVNPTPTTKKCLNSSDTTLLTSIVPVVVEGVLNYCPNLFWVIQKQYTVAGDIAIGTHRYWSDGQIALLDT